MVEWYRTRNQAPINTLWYSTIQKVVNSEEYAAYPPCSARLFLLLALEKQVYHYFRVRLKGKDVAVPQHSLRPYLSFLLRTKDFIGPEGAVPDIETLRFLLSIGANPNQLHIRPWEEGGDMTV